ncbi:MAG: YraN family protein [Chloroflexi bacterium]|nr:YraN family protein [Chloroflexota bacterium]
MSEPRDGGRRALGRWGEDLAARRLAQLGYHILERNFRRPEGEADLIAIEGGALVVIEVKTRRSLRFGSPAEAITPQKARRLAALLDIYRAEHPEAPEPVRVDVVGVLAGGTGPPRVEILRNAVEGA